MVCWVVVVASGGVLDAVAVAVKAAVMLEVRWVGGSGLRDGGVAVCVESPPIGTNVARELEVC